MIFELDADSVLSQGMLRTTSLQRICFGLFRICLGFVSACFGLFWCVSVCVGLFRSGSDLFRFCVGSVAVCFGLFLIVSVCVGLCRYVSVCVGLSPPCAVGGRYEDIEIKTLCTKQRTRFHTIMTS